MIQKHSSDHQAAPIEPGSDPGNSLPGSPLAGQERVLKALATGTTHLVALIEGDGTIAYVGDSVTYLLGYTPAELVGTNVIYLVHPDDQGMAVSMLGAVPVSDQPPGRDWEDADASGDYRLQHKSGDYVPFEVLRNNFLADPEIGALLVIGRPVIARWAMDDALNALAHGDESEHPLVRLAHYLDVRVPGISGGFVSAGPDPLWISESLPEDLLVTEGPWQVAMRDSTIVYTDVEGPVLTDPVRAAAEAHGYVACWSLPLPLYDIQVYSPAHRPRAEEPALGCVVIWSTKYLRPVEGQLGVVERIAALAEIGLRRIEMSREIQRLLDHDQLTGALSRNAFERIATHPSAGPAAYLALDLDGFKPVNDRYGHYTGDQVLKVTVQRVQAALRERDVICRMGGDEFVVRLEGADPGAATAVAERIIQSMRNPVKVDDTSLAVGLSLGVAPYQDGLNHSEMLRRADAAMYAAKRAGKARYRVWQGDDVEMSLAPR